MWREPTAADLELISRDRKLITKAGSFIIILVFLFPAIFGIVNFFELIGEPSPGKGIELVVDIVLAGAILYGNKCWKKAMRSDIDEKTLMVSEAVITDMESYTFDQKAIGNPNDVRIVSAYRVTVKLRDLDEVYTVKANHSFGDSHKVGDEVHLFCDKIKREEKYMFLA